MTPTSGQVFTLPFSLCLCLFSSYKNISHIWLGTHPDPIWLHTNVMTSVMTLFPNKVTFWSGWTRTWGDTIQLTTVHYLSPSMFTFFLHAKCMVLIPQFPKVLAHSNINSKSKILSKYHQLKKFQTSLSKSGMLTKIHLHWVKVQCLLTVIVTAIIQVSKQSNET